MPRYRYIARTKAGERVEGATDQPDRAALIRRLQGDGLILIGVTEIGPASASAAVRAPDTTPSAVPAVVSFRPLRASELAEISRELSDLMNAGLTLGRALHALARRGEGEARAALFARLRDEIVRGASFSEALRSAPGVFPDLYINIVRAGEASGRLAETLGRLATHYEQLAATREKVLAALAYPLFVLVVGLLTVVFAVAFVVPRFNAIFQQLGSSLPLPTRMLIGLSRGVIRHGPWLAPVFIAVGVAALRALRTPAGQRWRDALALRLPLVRSIVRAAVFGRFARTLASLLKNGVPVLRAMEIVEATVGNVIIAEAVREARARVTDGATISAPLAAGGVFPPLLTDILAVGEETGDLPGALERIAQRYDAELERRLRVTVAMIEPLLILLVALLVGFIAISLLTAVFEMTSGLKVR